VLILYSIFNSIVERGRSVQGERTPLLSTTPLLLSPQMKGGLAPKGSQYGSTISQRSL
jgi:hypothetical protein